MNIAIIPARGGSKRIPDKNIVDFLGSPLMSYSINAAKTSGLFDTVHVSTDSARIADVASKFGSPVDFMRPAELADDHTGIVPVMQWVLDQYEQRGKTFHSVCLLMPTAALIDANDLRESYKLYAQHNESRAVIAVARYSAPVEWAYHMSNDGALTPREPHMASVRSQDLQPAYFDSGTFMFIPAKDVKAGRVDHERMIAYSLPRYKALDIDEADDLTFAEIVARGLKAAH